MAITVISDLRHSQYKSPTKPQFSGSILQVLLAMVPCFLLTLLLVSSVSAEIKCIGKYSKDVPSIASCNVVIKNLAQYLLPCLGHETVKVGKYGNAIADIKLPIIFADDTKDPQQNPRCGIVIDWDGADDEYESVPPINLQTFATTMKTQCIAASPPRMALGEIEPSRRIWMRYEGAFLSTGNWTTMMVNGTEIPVHLPHVNPRDACRSSVEPSYGVNLDSPPSLVESS